MSDNLLGWLCIFLPWHNWKIVGRPSPWSEKLRCRWCRREWGFNLDTGITLPWRCVAGFYATRATPPEVVE